MQPGASGASRAASDGAEAAVSGRLTQPHRSPPSAAACFKVSFAKEGFIPRRVCALITARLAQPRPVECFLWALDGDAGNGAAERNGCAIRRVAHCSSEGRRLFACRVHRALVRLFADHATGLRLQVGWLSATCG